MRINTEQLLKAQSLKAEGWSLQEIANKLVTSKSSVYRLLNENGTEEKEEQSPMQNPIPILNSNEYLQLEKLKLELAHKVRMEELSQARKKIELEERAASNKLNLERSQIPVTPVTTKVDFDHKKQFQKRSKRLVEAFQTMLGTIQSEIGTATLEVEEWQQNLNQLIALQDKIQDHATLLDCDDYESLAIWHYTARLIAFVEEMLEEHDDRFFKPTVVKVAYDLDFCEEVKDMALDYFLDEIEFDEED